MKLLLLLCSEDTSKIVSWYAKPLGFDPVWYRHVLKAMDNLDEIDPDVVIISARDFPRHWKLFLQFLQCVCASCPVIILRGDAFPLEDSAQAIFLGANALIAEALEDPADLDRLLAVLSKAVPVEERHLARRYYEAEWNRFGFVFSSPGDKCIVTGEVKNISPTHIAFCPDQAEALRRIAVNTELRDCSLRAGEAALSPVCTLLRPGRVALFEFRSFPPHERELFDAYLHG
jgi:hypothetical protein